MNTSIIDGSPCHTSTVHVKTNLKRTASYRHVYSSIFCCITNCKRIFVCNTIALSVCKLSIQRFNKHAELHLIHTIGHIRYCLLHLTNQTSLMPVLISVCSRECARSVVFERSYCNGTIICNGCTTSPSCYIFLPCRSTTINLHTRVDNHKL